jgi:hypothetical protein
LRYVFLLRADWGEKPRTYKTGPRYEYCAASRLAGRLAYFRFGLFEPGEFLRLPAIFPTHFVGIAEGAGPAFSFEAFAHGPSSQTQFIFHPRPRDGFPFADLFEGVANFFG